MLISGANTFPQNISVNALNATLGNIDDNNAGFGGNITLNSSLTISSQSVSPANALTFAGNIVHGSGTNSVTLTGPGNVVFLGNATYLGSTTINGGCLTVGATGSLPATTSLNINNGSTVTLSNTAQTLAGLNGSPGSTLVLAYRQRRHADGRRRQFRGLDQRQPKRRQPGEEHDRDPIPHRRERLLRLGRPSRPGPCCTVP